MLMPPIWPQYVFMENNKRQIQEWAKLIPSLKAWDCGGLVFKTNINYCPETHTSFDSFYKLTVVYKWQLDSSVTTQAFLNSIENFLRTERKDM